MNTNLNILNATNISKYFYEPEKFQVLKDINFSVNRGEFLSIVGKSGCGKSTLLYILSTMDTDYQGELWINNSKLTGLSQNELATFRNQHIGFVFQFHYLLPEFTVLENIMLPGLKLGKYSKGEIKDKAMHKLQILGLEQQAHKTSNKLSGGQQQRVSIARALINDPLLIICDEPTGNLDSVNTKIVFDTFKILTQEQKQTIIAVTHDNEFAANSDRIVHMLDGEIIKS